jgi:hypothetical protein
MKNIAVFSDNPNKIYVHYIMALFDTNLKALNEYRNHPRVKSATEGYVMLTRKEFTDWYTPISSTRSKTLQNMSHENVKLITELLIDVCRKGIQDNYLKRTIGHVYPYRKKGRTPPQKKFDEFTRDLRNTYFDARKDRFFDLLVCVKEDVYRATNTTQDDKTDSIISFLVSELGECKRKPNTMSVNLICSKSIRGFKANFLLAAMMYCVKDSKYDKEVVLELAGKYSGNIGGFKSYSRVGFDRDPSLYGYRCFEDIDNLPMSVRVDILEKEQIVAYAIENRQASELKDDLAKHFYLLPQLAPRLAKQIGQIADFYHELDVDEEPEDAEYNKIIKGAKSKAAKKQKLFQRIQSLTPKNTPVHTTRRKKRKADKQIVGTLLLAKKKLAKEQTRSVTPRNSPSSRSTQRTKPPSRSKSRGRVSRRDD